MDLLDLHTFSAILKFAQHRIGRNFLPRLLSQYDVSSIVPNNSLNRRDTLLFDLKQVADTFVRAFLFILSFSRP